MSDTRNELEFHLKTTSDATGAKELSGAVKTSAEQMKKALGEVQAEAAKPVSPRVFAARAQIKDLLGEDIGAAFTAELEQALKRIPARLHEEFVENFKAGIGEGVMKALPGDAGAFDRSRREERERLQAIIRQGAAEERELNRQNAAAERTAAEMRKQREREVADIIRRSKHEERELNRQNAALAVQTQADQKRAALDRIAAERRATAAARAAARAEESQRVSGGGGAFGKVAGGLGFGGMAGAVATGMAAGAQIANIISQIAEYRKQAEAAERGISEELTKQIGQWREMAAGVKDVNGLQELQAKLALDVANAHASAQQRVASVGDTFIDGLKTRLGRDFVRGIGFDPETTVDKAAKAAERDLARLETQMKQAAERAEQLLNWQDHVKTLPLETQVESFKLALADVDAQRERLAASPLVNAQGLAELVAEAQLFNGLLKEAEQQIARNADAAKRDLDSRSKAGLDAMAKEIQEGQDRRERETKEKAEQAAKEAAQLNDILKKQQEIDEEQKDEQAILRAKLAGQDDLVQTLEIERAKRQQIKELGDQGLLTEERRQQIEITAELQKQVVAMEQKKNLRDAMRKLEDVEGNFAGVDSPDRGDALRAVKRAREDFAKRQRRAEEDAREAGATPDQIYSQRLSNKGAFEADLRAARGRFGGDKSQPTADGSENKGAIGKKYGFDFFGNPDPNLPRRSPAAPAAAGEQVDTRIEQAPAAGELQQAAQGFAAGGADLAAAAATVKDSTGSIKELSTALQDLGGVVVSLASNVANLKQNVATARNKMGN